MKFKKLYGASGILWNLDTLYYNNESSVVEINDAIEDAHDSKSLVENLGKLKLLRHFSLDKETAKYVRLVSSDKLGNKMYLEAEFEETLPSPIQTFIDTRLVTITHKLLVELENQLELQNLSAEEVIDTIMKKTGMSLEEYAVLKLRKGE